MLIDKEDDMTTIDNSTSNTYSIKVQGYGGEIVLGKVPEKVYKYFIDHAIDLADFAYNKLDTQISDHDMYPFTPGEWFECNDIAHELGVEMDSTSVIEVKDQNGAIIWAATMDAGALEEIGCEIVTGEDIYASDQSPGTVVFYGQQFDKGVFFDGSFESAASFDPRKLKFLCTDIEGWSICSGIEYDNRFVEGDEYEAEEQDAHFAFIKILENGNTESYTGPDDNDYDVEEMCL